MITAANAQGRNRSLAALLCAGALLLLVLQLAVLGARAQIFGDFHAFYCGGAAVLHGSDPYAASSLGACEAQAQPMGLQHVKDGVIAPVPFPGYAFALFVPFAALPYVPAAGLWLALLLVCALAAAVMLARLAGLHTWIALALMAGGFPLAVLVLGEVAPIALAALCAAALALRAKRFWNAAIFLCVAAILPNVLLPAFLAVFIFLPRARVPLTVCGAGLLALDLIISGPGGALAYFTHVLPAHAQSEIGYVAQYGLTWVLHAAGSPDRAALFAGNVSYVLACAAGIICAGAAARTLRERSLIATLPCAFAVTGGPFVHYSEITLALPALLILFARAGGNHRALCTAALLLLAVPWQWIVGEPQLALPAALVIVYVLSLALTSSGDYALRASALAVLFASALMAAALHFGPQVQQMHGTRVDPALAQAAWTAYIRTQGASAGTVWWLAKSPTWLGLFLLAACGVYAASKKKFVTAPVVERAPLGA